MKRRPHPLEPRPNKYPAPCAYCGTWLDSGEGLTAKVPGSTGRWHTYHEGCDVAPAMKLTERDRGFSCGVAVACGIIQSCFDQPQYIAEALAACGLETAAKMRRHGVDEYDIELCRPGLQELKRKRKRPTPPDAECRGQE